MRKLIWCGLILASSTLCGSIVHYVSKTHYVELGKNYGSIDERINLLREIDSTLPNVHFCPDGKDGGGWKKILSVKADAVYIKSISDTSVVICRAR
jgi:hypothetical protein